MRSSESEQPMRPPEGAPEDYSYAEFEQDCDRMDATAKERTELFLACVGFATILTLAEVVLR